MPQTPPQTDTYNTALDIFDRTHPLRVDPDENLKVTVTNQAPFTFDANGNLLVDSVVLKNLIWTTDTDFNKGTFTDTVVVGTGPSALLEPEVTAGANPVGWWHFDEASGFTAGDSSGNGNNGTATGTTIVAGLIGNARSYTGTDHIIVTNSSSIDVNGGAITLECWVNPTTIADLSAVYDKDQGSGKSYVLYFYGGQINFLIPGVHLTAPSSLLPLGQWSYIVCTYDPSITTATIYINAVAQTVDAAAVASASWVGNTNNLMMGLLNGGESWNGVIDECAVYNVALNQSQINFRYNGGAGTEAPLTLNYATSSSWQSNVYDSGAINQNWGFFNVSELVPSGCTVTIQAHVTNDLTNWPAYGSPLTIGQSIGLSGQFIQFLISFTNPASIAASVDYISALYSYPPITNVTP